MKYLEILAKYSFFSIAPLLTAIIQLFSVFLIGHKLTSYELGLAGIFNTLIFILVFLSDGGSSNYFIYRKVLSFREVKVINILNILISFLSIFLYFLFSPGAFKTSFITMFCFLIISFTITMPLYNYSRLLIEKKFNVIAGIEIFSKMVFILTLSLMLYGLKIQGLSVVYAWTVSYASRLFMFILACKKISLYQANESASDKRIIIIIKQWWAYVHNQIFSQALNYITLTADIFIISHFGGFERVGIYSLCKDATLKISAVISPVIGKLLISHVVTNNIKQIKLNFNKIFFAILFVALSVFIGWGLLGPFLLEKLRPELEAGFELYIYFWAACGVLRMLINPIATIFQGLGETRKELYINTISLLSFIVIFIFIKISNFTGNIILIVLITLVGMYIVSLLFSCWIIKKRFLKV